MTIADELGISVGTVKSTTSRALAKVRDRYPDLVNTKGPRIASGAFESARAETTW